MVFRPQKQAPGSARGHARYAGAKHVCALQCLISVGGSVTWYRVCSVVLCVHCGAHYSDVMVTRLSGFIGRWRAHMSSCSPTERGLRKLLTCAVFKERTTTVKACRCQWLGHCPPLHFSTGILQPSWLATPQLGACGSTGPALGLVVGRRMPGSTC